MRYYRKRPQDESPKAQKRRRDDSALKNVVSLRISDKEKKTLERITKSSSKNVSEVIREALDLWMAQRQRLCLDA